MPVGIRFGVVGVAFEHQHRDAPDVDLRYRAEDRNRRAFEVLDRRRLGILGTSVQLLVA